MPSTKFVAVYDQATKRIRRLILPSDDAELFDGTHGLQEGEANYLFDQADFPIPADPTLPYDWAAVEAKAQGILNARG